MKKEIFLSFLTIVMPLNLTPGSSSQPRSYAEAINNFTDKGVNVTVDDYNTVISCREHKYKTPSRNLPSERKNPNNANADWQEKLRQNDEILQARIAKLGIKANKFTPSHYKNIKKKQGLKYSCVTLACFGITGACFGLAQNTDSVFFKTLAFGSSVISTLFGLANIYHTTKIINEYLDTNTVPKRRINILTIIKEHNVRFKNTPFTVEIPNNL